MGSAHRRARSLTGWPLILVLMSCGASAGDHGNGEIESVPMACFSAAHDVEYVSCMVNGSALDCRDLFSEVDSNQVAACEIPFDPRGSVTSSVSGGEETRRCPPGMTPHVASVQTVELRGSSIACTWHSFLTCCSGSEQDHWPTLLPVACSSADEPPSSSWESYSVSFGRGQECYERLQPRYQAARDPAIRVSGQSFREVEIQQR